ncbi:MAG: DHA2 family efflux MFS transporter permease subunit [Chromatiales bacterium]|jgi:MFS transporter, DHA2 family, multidrug resistance protein|nr:DHA2 family efflux MFS transporter permease subunit [Chromatiales bacterium]
MTQATIAPELSPLHRGLILATVTTATGLYAMTITIANVALPKIQGAFAATPDQVAWVVTFNILATAVATPITGWLAARFGTRRVLLCGVFGFVMATVLCGLATSLVELVLFRFIQGAFGAPLAPLSQAIVLDSYPRERQGAATAIYGMGVVLGPIIAPTVGGYLTELYNWRWVFFMVVPFGIACFVGLWVFIHDRRDRSPTRLDWTGFIALAIAIAALQLMLDRGERNGWFESIETVLEATVALTAFYVFVVHSLTTSKPFLSPRLLLDRSFIVGLTITLTFGMLNVTPMVLLPPMLQGLMGYPDTIIGLLLGARAVGTLVGFFIIFFAGRFDPRIWIALGFASQGVAGYMMAGFNLDVSTADIAWASAVQGLGVGLLWVPITMVTFSTLDPKFLPDGMAMFHLLRNMGSSIHVSISVAVVVHTTQVSYAGLVEHISPFKESLRLATASGVWSVDSLTGLSALSAEVHRQSAMIGYINGFYLYALTSLLVIPCILLVRVRR